MKRPWGCNLAHFKAFVNFLLFRAWGLGLWTPADRRILEEQILRPILADRQIKRLLFVGVESYCQTYFQGISETEIWTIDPNPKVKAYGSARHIVDFVQNLDKYVSELGYFDVMIMNGVLGFGVNSQAEALAAMESGCRHLSKNGVLILGYNPELVPDIDLLSIKEKLGLRDHVWPSLGCASLRVPSLAAVPMSHCYQFYRKQGL